MITNFRVKKKSRSYGRYTARLWPKLCWGVFPGPPENIMLPLAWMPLSHLSTQSKVFCTLPSSIVNRSIATYPFMFSSNEQPLFSESPSTQGQSVIQAPTLPTAGPRKRRGKSPFNDDQISVLERYFAEDHIQSAAQRREIASRFGCTPQQVASWFQYRCGCQLSLARFIWSQRYLRYAVDEKKRRIVGGYYTELHTRGSTPLSSRFLILIRLLILTLLACAMKMTVSFLISGTSLSDYIRQTPYFLFPVGYSLSVHGTESISKVIRTS